MMLLVAASRPIAYDYHRLGLDNKCRTITYRQRRAALVKFHGDIISPIAVC